MMEKIHKLEPILLKNMMVLSEQYIEAEKENINDINVFPIPDGDTGSNMYYTIKAIVKEVNNMVESNGNNAIFQAISKGSFVGAKGNSGVIYSQFLIGVVEYLEKTQIITPLTFAKALEEGTEFAYDAVLNPTEGTILTVMKRTSDKAIEITLEQQDIDWIEFIDLLVEESKQCVEETTEMLEILKEANVVDAGAKGFFHVLESWKEVISNQ
ncbi:MAG: DAK2 domain-containing protein [Candidatus Heimdallarchaeota archaeon]|nr:DAK2 domain-containing protein [Candidatus Heimdallarchaeota archaeon]